MYDTQSDRGDDPSDYGVKQVDWRYLEMHYERIDFLPIHSQQLSGLLIHRQSYLDSNRAYALDTV